MSEAKRNGKEIVRVISFHNFAIFCVEHDLFTSNIQQNFLKIKDKSECFDLLGGIELIEDKLKLVEERFKALGKYEYYHNTWIEPIRKKIKEDYKREAYVILIKQKLIEAESIRVYTAYFIFSN